VTAQLAHAEARILIVEQRLEEALVAKKPTSSRSRRASSTTESAWGSPARIVIGETLQPNEEPGIARAAASPS
jgi:hypothetical protein